MAAVCVAEAIPLAVKPIHFIFGARKRGVLHEQRGAAADETSAALIAPCIGGAVSINAIAVPSGVGGGVPQSQCGRTAANRRTPAMLPLLLPLAISLTLLLLPPLAEAPLARVALLLLAGVRTAEAFAGGHARRIGRVLRDPPPRRPLLSKEIGGRPKALGRGVLGDNGEAPCGGHANVPQRAERPRAVVDVGQRRRQQRGGRRRRRT